MQLLKNILTASVSGLPDMELTLTSPLFVLRLSGELGIEGPIIKHKSMKKIT